MKPLLAIYLNVESQSSWEILLQVVFQIVTNTVNSPKSKGTWGGEKTRYG